MNHQAAQSLAKMAFQRLFEENTRFCPNRIRALMRPMLVDLRPGAPDALEHWLNVLPNDAPGVDFSQAMAEPEAIVTHLATQTRRAGGIYPTPPALADAMAGQIRGEPSEAAIDLSAGAGTLLASAIRRAPQLRAIGVELNPT